MKRAAGPTLRIGWCSSVGWLHAAGLADLGLLAFLASDTESMMISQPAFGVYALLLACLGPGSCAGLLRHGQQVLVSNTSCQVGAWRWPTGVVCLP